MLRQIQRLTRDVRGAGPGACAIAVYAEPSELEAGDGLALQAARETGFEGVACVDDAARAVVLYCDLWRRWHVEWARTAALALLRFLAHMQASDGRFDNFIVDWSGRRNSAGSTSYPGGAAWQARGLHALACAVSTFGQAEWDARFKLALEWVDAPTPYLDVRAVGILGVLEHWQATRSSASADRALAWAAEIAAHATHDGLLNAADVLPIHLWGHLQERALAATGRAFGRTDLVECARASADALLMPAVEGCFPASRVLPFDVSCTVAGLTAVAVATGDARYAAAATRGREWFRGRNSAHQAVYDRQRGLVFDGIDSGQVSRNSGAESNIEGGLTLL